MASSTRPRRLRKLLTYVVLQLAAAGAVLEIGSRIAEPRHRLLGALVHRPATEADYAAADSLPELMRHTSLGFRPLEVDYGYVLNSRSMRTKEYQTTKPPGTYRMVALGDSFVYGVVPEADHWVTLTGLGLASRRGGEVEALRLGVPATGLPFYLRLWQLEGARLAPDLVVLGLFVGNDFFDELGGARGWAALKRRLIAASYTVRLARNLLRLARGLDQGLMATRDDSTRIRPEKGGYELEELSRGFDETKPSFSAEAYAAIEAERRSLCARRNLDVFEAQLAKVTERLATLHREVAAAGAELVVMIIPDEYQVDPEMLAGTSAADFDLQLPQRRLKAFFEERGIDHLDVLPVFRERARQERLYLLRDSHWNRAGNRLAAELLLRHLGASDSESSVLGLALKSQSSRTVP